MRGIFLALLLFLIFLLANIPLAGQNHSIPLREDPYKCFIRFGTKQGLSHPVINDIIQDQKGLIWIATEDGLNRFDGYHFVVFRNQASDSDSIPGNIVTTLATDQKGNLWVGTTMGLCKIDLESGKVVCFLSNPNSENCPRNNHIRKILCNAGDVLWIETLDGTLTQYDLKKNAWKHFSHQPVTQPYYRYHALYADHENNIWFGGRNLGIHKLDENQKINYFQAEPKNPIKKRDNDLADIYRTRNKQWFVVATDGIYSFYPEASRFKKLLGTSAFSIAEDQEGNVWFGSGSGLIKYDPSNPGMTQYKFNPDNMNSLTDNQINKVYFDRQDNLWIGTREGLCLLTAKSSAYTYYYRIPGNNQSLSSNKVTSLAGDQEGNLWIGTADCGINILMEQKGQLMHYTHNANNPSSLASNAVSVIYQDKIGNMWVGLWAGVGFDKFDPKSRSFSHFAFDLKSRKRDWYNAFMEDSKGRFWAGLWGAKGLHLFNRDLGQFEKGHFMMPHVPYNQPVMQIEPFQKSFLVIVANNIIYEYLPAKNEFVPHLYQGFRDQFQSPASTYFEYDLPINFEKAIGITSSSEFVWFLSNRGIFTLDKEGKFEIFIKNSSPSEIPASACYSRDTVWVLYSGKIKAYSRDKKELFTYNLPMQFLKKSYKSNIIKNPDGSLWIIASTGVYLLKYDQNQEIVNTNIPVKVEHPEAVFLLGKQIWVGTKDGIYIRNLDKNGIWTKYKNTAFPKVLSVSAMIKSHSDQIAIFSEQGFFLIDEQLKVKRIALTSNFPAFTTNMSTAAFSDNDCIVAADSLNMFRIDLKSGIANMISKPDKTMLASHLITRMIEWTDGSFFIGSSDHGLTRLNPETSITKHYNSWPGSISLDADTISALAAGPRNKLWVGTSRGLYILDPETDSINKFQLPSKQISAILYQTDTSIWVATRDGLYCINPESKSFRQFTTSDGFPFIDFSEATCRMKNGNLAFGSNSGVIIFNPKKLNYRENQVETNITGFNLFGKRVQSFFSSNDTLRLDYTENFFSFDFAASDYSSVSSNAFYYRLANIDQNWVYSKEPKATYTNVMPGNYIFEVRQAVNEKNMGQNKATLILMISPPFWQTAWFRISVITLLLCIITGILWIYISRLRFERKSLNLEQKLLLSQMNPHFISNSLTAIQNYIYKNEPETAGNYLASFSKLIRQILEHSRDNFVTLENEITSLKTYISLQDLRFPQKFEYRIIKDDDLDENEILIPPMLAQPFIENAIEHGIMNSSEKGLLVIDYKNCKKYMQVSIEDNGIGIEKAREMSRNSEFKRKSLSTSIAVERLKAMGAVYDVSIFDLKYEGKTGTRIVLKIPFKNKNYDQGSDC